MADSDAMPGAPGEPPRGAAALFYSSVITRAPVELPQPTLPYSIGEVLPDGRERYELVSLVAAGSQAAVYRARDRKLSPDDPEPRVAVKLYPADVDPTGGNQALLEARAGQLAQDTSVITIIDVGRTRDGWPYLVMPLVRASDLRSWRVEHQKTLNSRRVASIGRDLAQALSSVHAAELVHCDVSPQNILVDGTGRAILADFGCSVHTAALTDAIGATPAFMAPERWTGAKPDERADIASLGAVLFWLATGEPPFGGDPAEIQAAHASPSEADARRRRLLASVNLEAPIADLIRRALAPNPADRPTAEELLDAIDDWFARASRTRKRTVAAVLAGLSVAAAVAIVVLSQTPPRAVGLGGTSELPTLAEALGLAADDRNVVMLAAQGRSPDFARPVHPPEETLAWLDGRRGAVARLDPVRRWTVATLAASLALDVNDQARADFWLTIAESAHDEPEGGIHTLEEVDPRWHQRLQSLVAAARIARVRRATDAANGGTTTGDVPPIPIVEAMHLRDWLDAGIHQGWQNPPGVPTRTTALLESARGQLSIPK